MATLADLGIQVPTENVVPEFTAWLPWHERKIELDGHPLGDYSGVYLLAHFERGVPKGAADPMAPEIIYIGEAGLLGRRWYDFQRSIGGDSGHSGGHTYRDHFEREAPHEALHVAAFPVWLKKSEPDGQANDPCSLTCRLRHYVEQALLWHHFYRRTGATLLNRK